MTGSIISNSLSSLLLLSFNTHPHTSLHCVSEKMSLHFDNNLNVNYTNAIIFGTNITQFISYWMVVSLFHLHLFNAAVLPWELPKSENHEFGGFSVLSD